AARPGMGDGGVPHLQAVATPAQIGPHDVEAEEGEPRVVIDARDGRRRASIELADQKTVRIDGGETGAVSKAGIPALGRRPVDGELDLLGPHRANMQAACSSHGRSSMLSALRTGLRRRLRRSIHPRRYARI